MTRQEGDPRGAQSVQDNLELSGIEQRILRGVIINEAADKLSPVVYEVMRVTECSPNDSPDTQFKKIRDALVKNLEFK